MSGQASEAAMSVEVEAAAASNSSPAAPKSPSTLKARPGLRDSPVGLDELAFPKAIITRLAKASLPAGTQLQGNASLALQRSATVFVNYLASHANNHTRAANRKTIAPTDVLRALEDVELGAFAPRLRRELELHEELGRDKRARKERAKEADAGPEDRPVKRPRVEVDVGGAGQGLVDDTDAPSILEGDTIDVGETRQGDTEEEDDLEEDDADEAEEDVDDDVMDELEESALPVADETAVELEGQGGDQVEDEALDNGDDSD
jgi:DNA polymerase epsilon subunit 3